MSARDRALLVVIAVVGLVAGAWMLLIKPEHTKAQNLGAQVSDPAGPAHHRPGPGQQPGWPRAPSSPPTTPSWRAWARRCPTDDEVPSLIYQLQSAASAAKVDFRTLQMASNSEPAAAHADAEPSSSASSSRPRARPPAPRHDRLRARAPGTAGLPTEQFTFQFTGSFFHLSGFFKRLQQFVVANNKHISVSGRLLTINASRWRPAPRASRRSRPPSRPPPTWRRPRRPSSTAPPRPGRAAHQQHRFHRHVKRHAHSRGGHDLLPH